MPILAVSITKDMPYRGSRERFSNVYHYEVANPSVAVAQDIISRLVAVETPVHSTQVQFKEARVWETGGTPEQNETILITDLSSFGTAVDNTELYAAAVYEVQWRTDRPSSTGKPVYLRKYLRSKSLLGQALNNEQKTGFAALPNAIPALTTYMDGVRTLVTPGGTYGLTAPSGRVVSQAGQLPRYISIHELTY